MVDTKDTIITFASRKIQMLLVAFFILLQVAYGSTLYAKFALGNESLGGLTNLFNFDAEASLPTWFQSTLLIITAILLYMVGRIKKRRGNAIGGKWVAFSLVFWYLSMDEGSMIHELLNEPIRKIFGIDQGFLYYAWVIPGVVCLGILAVYFWKFISTMPIKIRSRVYLAGFIYIAGSLIGEAISAGLVSAVGRQSLEYACVSWAEETCEMVGLIFFISTLLVWFETDIGAFAIDIK